MNKVKEVNLSDYLNEFCKGCVTKKITPKESNKVKCNIKKGEITNG